MAKQRDNDSQFSETDQEYNYVLTRQPKGAPDALRFYEEQQLYEDLCREVEYILQKRLKKDDIPVGVITSRAKSYRSYSEKLAEPERRGKAGTVRDRAGARVVYLYKSDLCKIEAAIKDEFTVVDKKDTSTDQEPGQFGYSDVKFYVKLKKQVGPRYDDLKGLLCEIQVRTVGQDAWAIVSRDLVYKKKSGIPKKHLKALTRFVNLFEIADENFDTIHNALQKERQEIAAKTTEEFLEQVINVDTIMALILKEFAAGPEMPLHAGLKKRLAATVDWLQRAGYKKLKELKDVFEKAADMRKLNEAWRQERGWAYHPIHLFQMALEATDKSYGDYIQAISSGVNILYKTRRAMEAVWRAAAERY